MIDYGAYMTIFFRTIMESFGSLIIENSEDTDAFDDEGKFGNKSKLLL